MHCPAKLNLSLHVLGNRADGFSELDSVVALIDWHDELTISDYEGDSPSHGDVHFTSNDPALEALGEDNLVLRGIRAVQARFQKKHQTPLVFPPVHVHLEKCLPYQAGLGSASSNAASAIKGYYKGMRRLMPELKKLSSPELGFAGASVGSDVPLFLLEKSFIHMQGRGERIQAIERYVFNFQEAQLLILKAEHIAISTKDAYAWVHEANAYSTPDRNFASLLARGYPLTDLTKYMHNDFEGVVFEKHPELRGLKNALLDAGAFHAMLCGSGSAIVGFFDRDTMPSPVERDLLATSLGVKLWQTTFL